MCQNPYIKKNKRTNWMSFGVPNLSCYIVTGKQFAFYPERERERSSQPQRERESTKRNKWNERTLNPLWSRLKSVLK